MAAHGSMVRCSKVGSRRAIGIALVLFASALALPATAVEKVWGFEGTVTSYAGGGGMVPLVDMPIGSVVRGQFRFDDTAVDTNGSANAGSYATIAFALGFEGTSMLHLGLTTSATIEIENDVADGPNFRDSFGLEDVSAPVVPTLEDLMVLSLDFELQEVDNPAPTVMASDALPASPPALIDFTTLTSLQILGYVNAMSNTTDFTVTISEFGEPGTIDLPVIPDSTTTNPDGSVTWTFDTLGVSLCATACWIDPPTSTSFTYTMTNSALFTSIADFPPGFSSDFDVSVGGSSLGTFGPGDSVDFSGYPGGGVSEFVVSGIDPATDTSSAAAFPLELTFDSTAEFTMTSSPLPAVPSFGLAGLGVVTAVLAGAGVVAYRTRRIDRRPG